VPRILRQKKFTKKPAILPYSMPSRNIMSL
jgi:hypothetical protein